MPIDELEPESMSAQERFLAKQRRRKMERIQSSNPSSLGLFVGVAVGLGGMLATGLAVAFGGASAIFSPAFLGIMFMIFVPGAIIALVARHLSRPGIARRAVPGGKKRRIEFNVPDTDPPGVGASGIPGAVQDAFDDVDRRTR